MQTQLAAIFVLDVAGYSRRMHTDELGTHEALMQLRKHSIEPRIAEHQGHVVKFTGDGVMARFSSAVEATRCAIDIQRDTTDETVLGKYGDKLELRIGIHLGEIIFEEDKDIYGDDVNIAARLEQIATPGCIYVSRAVHDQVVKKTNIPFVRIGQEKVKNIAEPIQVYAIDIAGELTSVHTARRKRSALYISVAVILAAIVALILIYRPQVERELVRDLNVADETGKPTVAVLPFTDLSENKSSIYFADGITEDIINDLSKVSAVNVISRNSTAQFKAAGTVPQDLYEELGARYVLVGNVQRRQDADRIMVNAKLTDSKSGKSLWAEQYDVALNGIFELQQAVVDKIVEIMAVRVSKAEQSRIMNRDTSSISAYEGFNKAWRLYQKNNPRDLSQALLELLKVIEIDANYAKAYAAIGHIYFKSWLWGWESYANTDFQSAPGLAKDFLRKSLAVGSTAVAHQLSANIALYDRRFDEASQQALRAIELEPSDTNGLLTMAEILIYMGQQKTALPYVEKVSRLDPLNPAYVSFLLGLIAFGDEKFERASQFFEKALEQNPEDFAPAAPLTAAYAKLGDSENMRRALQRYLEGWPRASIKVFRIYWPYQHKVDEDRLLSGLRRAGMPES